MYYRLPCFTFSLSYEFCCIFYGANTAGEHHNQSASAERMRCVPSFMEDIMRVRGVYVPRNISLWGPTSWMWEVSAESVSQSSQILAGWWYGMIFYDYQCLWNGPRTLDNCGTIGKWICMVTSQKHVLRKSNLREWHDPFPKPLNWSLKIWTSVPYSIPIWRFVLWEPPRSAKSRDEATVCSAWKGPNRGQNWKTQKWFVSDMKRNWRVTLCLPGY